MTPPHSRDSVTISLRCGESRYLLRATVPEDNSRSTYSRNTLSAQKAILDLLHSQNPSPLPVPTYLALDTSKSVIPYSYILLSLPSVTASPSTLVTLSQARQSVTQAQALKLDLRLGSYLHQLHEVQNDWFGTPAQEKDGIWSWQEAFTLLLENLLSHAESHQDELGLSLPMVELRQCLSRAIGFFLFDDVEVPSLVSFTDDEDAILVEIPGENTEQDPEIIAFIGWEHGLWGDPMMEATLLEPNDAVLEGYGGPLVVFPRQKTKILWYALYAGLLTILEGRGGSDGVEVARSLVANSVQKLKGAPCY